MGTTKKNKYTCELDEFDVLSRPEKKELLEKIYSKAAKLLFMELGIDKDSVYAACQTLQTVSRELVVLDKIMLLTGELEPDADADNYTCYEVTDADARLEQLFASETADA
jgi:hypothetical protein